MKGSLSVDRSVIWFGFVITYFQRYLERSDGVLFNAFLVIIIMIDDADDDIGDVDDERREVMGCTRKFFLLKLKALLYPSFSFPS